MGRSSFLDPVEDRVIFRISRYFYHVLVTLAAVTTLGGALFLLVGLAPAIKERVDRKPDPPAVKITTDAVKTALQSSPPVQPATRKTPTSQPPASQSEEEYPQREKDIARLKSALNRPRILLPEPLYKWKDTAAQIRQMSPYGRPDLRPPAIGIERRLHDLTMIYEAPARRAEVLEDLAAVLQDFQLQDRLEPLKAFVRLHRDAEKTRRAETRKNEADYKKQLALVEADYQTRLTTKQLKRYTGMIVAGSGIASIALIGMFLVLLSIQREVKKIAGATLLGRSELEP